MKATTFIYALVDPKERDESHIYIGKSDNPFKRYKRHIKGKRKGHKYYWIQSLLKVNLKPNLQILEQCENETWQERERENIAFYKKCGFKVVNGTDGGEGMLGYYPSEETLKKLSIALKGRILSESHRINLSKANLGKHHTESSKQLISKANKNKVFTEEHKQLISKNNLGKHRNLPWLNKHRSDETKMRMRKPHKKGWHHTEEHKMYLSKINSGDKNSMSGRHHSEETKRLLHDILTGKNTVPKTEEAKANQRHAKSEETKAKMKLARKRREDLKQQGVQLQTISVKKDLTERQKELVSLLFAGSELTSQW